MTADGHEQRSSAVEHSQWTVDDRRATPELRQVCIAALERRNGRISPLGTCNPASADLQGRIGNGGEPVTAPEIEHLDVGAAGEVAVA